MATTSFGRHTPLRLNSKNKNLSSSSSTNTGCIKNTTTNNNYNNDSGYTYGRVCIELPPLPEDDNILDVGSKNLEDMESILEGVTNTLVTERVLEECHYYAKPHLIRHQHRRDLTALMTKNERQRLLETNTTTTRRHRNQNNNRNNNPVKTNCHDELLERMEHYLEKGLTRALNNKDDNNTQVTNTGGGIPMVWIIEPALHNKWNTNNKKKKNGKNSIRFKFSTDSDFGACFYLNEKESLEFIEILKKFSSSKKLPPYCKMYYQVYTMDSSESRVVKSDVISSLIKEIMIATTTATTTAATNSQKEVDKTNEKKDTGNDEIRSNGNECDDGDDRNDMTAATTPATNDKYGDNEKIDTNATNEGTKRYPFKGAKKEGYAKHSPAQRFARYLNHRRLKRLIYQQLNVALGNTTKKSRNKLFALYHPFLIIWKLITRRGF
eukprot:CAMPEP_0170793102 /NCGR_PEP_ID=MMETSP0733-20121128/22408_1 /TAXON_ID=186038 /ORGANISM="Fragilariopsis kerguelensis, Strain L26-C5" /LENGTH=436 /DNA_ID=CAMNT_0011141895 /DNA_START=127 /DNA_END=1437 /DNA_ORIENTATION=+